MTTPSPEEFAAAGLYDPATDATSGRLELLEWLDGLGFGIPEMQAGMAIGALPALAGDRALVPEPRLTRAEALHRTGLDGEMLDAYKNALGLEPIHGAPEGEVGYTDGIIELLGMMAELRAFFSDSEVIALSRVIASSVARIAEAAVSTFLTDVESDFVSEGRSELELGQTSFEAARLIDGMGHRLDPLLRRHVLQAVERTRATTVSDVERFEYRYAVGFVDLVGFTSLSGNLSARELSEFVADFDARSHDIVADSGARVVKLIGDEVMFVAADPSAVCQAGRALVEEFANDGDDVLPRGGMAYGNVVLRSGDYYGPVVNLASRLADQAVPGELLVTDELAHAAMACEFEPAGRRVVKGFAEPVQVHAMRAH